jgi:N-acetylglucosamine-6-phosphate deacetylase
MRTVKHVFTNAAVVTPEEVVQRASITVEDGIIQSVDDENRAEPSVGTNLIDCTDKYVMPGFIDVHTHGGAGFDFKDEAPDALATLSDYYYRHGVTTVLATLSPLSHDLLVQAVSRLAKFCGQNRGRSNIVGIHLEGPYINRSMSGGNKKEYIEQPDFNRWREVFDAGEGFIRLITVAPELNGIDRLIEDAVKNGITIALGHSTADGATAERAVRLGARQVTHIFNAMRGLHHREPDLLSTALLSDSLDAQIIADGVHVHPDIIRLAIKAKTAEHIMLITDSMRATGLSDGRYDSAGTTVTVQNGISRMPDGTLAGSTLVFENGLRLIASLTGMDLPSAANMASFNAARSLGLQKETGSIEVGKSADIVILDSAFNVEMTIRKGEIVFMRDRVEG